MLGFAATAIPLVNETDEYPSFRDEIVPPLQASVVISVRSATHTIPSGSPARGSK